MAVRTEGSWIFGPYGLVWAASDIGFADGRWHEVVPRPRIVATPASPADGPMLAAAPDLFEALRWFIDDIDGTSTDMAEFDANVARARAALLKASEGGA